MPTTSRTPSAAGGKPIATVTPTGLSMEGANQRMKVEKGVVDELLLVCGVIGSSNEDQLIPVTDCLNWLQDLQRALRRDDDTYRPISLLIGNWKVVQQKLLPLVMTCRYDTPLVLTIVKILVILTKPLSENAKRAGRMVIDTKSRKLPQSVIKEQIKLRENALAQSEMLMEYKRAIAHHASHLSSKSQEKKEGGLLSVFVSLLAEPLSKTGTARTDNDHLTIELVLHLFRNLLSAEPILKLSAEISHRSVSLHQELLVLFERELVLDIVLVIAQEMELRENAKYNLLMMELLNHLLRNQDPTAVARSVEMDGIAKHSTGKENSQNGIASGPSNTNQSTMKQANTKQISGRAASKSSGSLRSQLAREKQKISGIATTRHSQFGGTLMVKRKDGKRQYRSAVLGDKRSEPPAAKKRKNRRTDPFIGAGRTFACHTSGSISTGDDGPTAVRAQRSLHNFCSRFVKDCYGPVMKSLKNEFRRDSVRLEEGDKVVFFRIVWFFCQWWRVSGAGRSAKDQGSVKEGTPDDPSTALGQMIFTLDVFTFNLVLNATDTFTQHKKHTQLAHTVALYGEMMHMLLAMYRSQDSTENLMALGLLSRLFYGNEQLDRLPKLLSKWTPGTSTREYLCDLVELCHSTLKLLELNAKACLDGSDNMSEAEKKKNDTVARMKAAATEFDLSSYISRKIVSNQLVFMYTHLLSQYLINASHVNHHLVAFFLRLCKMNIVVSDDSDADIDPESTQSLLASKTVSLEPMLYHVQMFTVLNQILNDSSIRNDKEYETLLSFASGLMGNFARAAKANPMLYVECLFRHPVPHRFCELSTNMYVNEELRMIAERELLLDERRRLESEGEDDGFVGSNEDESRVQEGRGDGDLSGGDRRSTTTSAAEEEEESEWVDMDSSMSESTSHKTKSDDGSKKEKNHHGPQTADESDDEKWNDRRAFIPPKNRDLVDGKVEDENSTTSDGVLSAPESPPSQSQKSGVSFDKDKNLGDNDGVSLESPAKIEKTKKHRIRKVAREILLEDDDDIFDNEDVNQSATGTTSSRKFVFDDDDDE